MRELFVWRRINGPPKKAGGLGGLQFRGFGNGRHASTVECRGLFSHVRHQPHVPRSLDGDADGTLESRAGAGALAAKELALAGAELLQTLHVLVINEHRPGTAILGAKPT